MFFDDRRAAEDDMDQPESLVHGRGHRRARHVKKRTARRIITALLITLLIVVPSVFFGLQYKEAQDEVKRLSNPQEAAKEEVRRLTERISELVAVPEGETPTLATVEDPDKLKDQSFFAAAQKGDKVLIFTQAKRAVLYRPSTDRVIESSIVNIGGTNTNTNTLTPPQTSPTTNPTVKPQTTP